MLVAMRNDGSVLLERRPETGIWGGLWCLPEFETVSAASTYAGHTLRAADAQPKPLSIVEHAFTHFDLVITPLLTQCAGHSGIMDSIPTLWYNARDPARIGLPAPIKTLLENLSSPTLFDSSIAENIALGTEVKDIQIDRLRRASKLARLDSLVEALPNGYQEVIGEHGVRLSGWQCQRIGIARALYRDASVLILDEATSSLDVVVESEIMDTLESLRGSLTILLIAHRHSTLKRCDLVIELNEGRLTGSGTPEEIIGRFNPAVRAVATDPTAL